MTRPLLARDRRPVLSAGRQIWTEFVFPLQGMTAHWTNDCAAMSSSERLDGSQFLGTYLRFARQSDQYCYLNCSIGVKKVARTNFGRTAARARPCAYC